MSEPVRRQTMITRTVLSATAVALFALSVFAGAGYASEGNDRAGLIVYFDESSIELFLLELPEDETDGYEFLTKTGLNLEVQPFSGLGEAVCSIDDTGCPSSDCFCESYSSPAYFWQYFMYDGTQWVPQHHGARSHTVQPGEIVAWAWTDGTPDLPDVTIEELAELTTQTEDGASLTPTAPAAPVDEGEPTPTTDPARSPTVTEQASDDENGTDTTQCLQFLGFFGLLTAIVAWAGVRRYREPGQE